MNQSRGFAILMLVMLCATPVVWPNCGPAWAAESAAPSPMAQAVAAIKLKPDWQRIEISEERPDKYRLQLWYKPTGATKTPVRLARVEIDTKEIARAVLAELVKQGRKPAKEDIGVSVWAYQPGIKGETGTPLNIAFGATDYNPANDQLRFRDWAAIHGR